MVGGMGGGRNGVEGGMREERWRGGGRGVRKGGGWRLKVGETEMEVIGVEKGGVR